MKKDLTKKHQRNEGFAIIIPIVAAGCLILILLGFLFAAAVSGQFKGSNSKMGADGTGTSSDGTMVDCSGSASVPAIYMDWVKEASSIYLHDDAALIAIIQTESSWDPLSPRGKNHVSSAAGLGQFLYGTARGFPEFVGGNDKHGKTWPGGNVYKGIPASNPKDARFDAQRSIFATAHYFGSLVEKYGSPGEAYQRGYVGGGAGSAYAAKARSNFDKIYNNVKKGCTINATSEGNVFDAKSSGCNNVPLFTQCDSRWKNVKILQGHRTICRAGCMLTATAMVLRHFGANVDPKVVAAYANEDGRSGSGGVNGIFWTGIASEYKLKYSRTNWNTGLSYLKKGVPVIVYGKGSGSPFRTSNRHFMVVTCFDFNNRTAKINDPMNRTTIVPESLLRANLIDVRIFYK